MSPFKLESRERHLITIDKPRQMDFNHLASFPMIGAKSMNVEISCELYARLSAIPLLLDPADDRKYLKSLYIERRNSKLLAVVTNVKIAAIEYIGDDAGPDECTAITIDPVLVAQCEKEIVFNSRLVIVANPLLSFTSIKTTFGYNYSGNAMVQLPEANNLIEWRTWFPDEMPTKTFGPMFWRGMQIHALANAAPTGGLRFPEFIDTTRPVVVRDHESNDWVGLFMPVTVDGEKVDPASIPDWVS